MENKKALAESARTLVKNFCSKTGTKIKGRCNYCWVKKKPYNCGFDKCPGLKLYISEITQGI